MHCTTIEMNNFRSLFNNQSYDMRVEERLALKKTTISHKESRGALEPR